MRQKRRQKQRASEKTRNSKFYTTNPDNGNYTLMLSPLSTFGQETGRAYSADYVT